MTFLYGAFYICTLCYGRYAVRSLLPCSILSLVCFMRPTKSLNWLLFQCLLFILLFCGTAIVDYGEIYFKTVGVLLQCFFLSEHLITFYFLCGILYKL